MSGYLSDLMNDEPTGVRRRTFVVGGLLVAANLAAWAWAFAAFGGRPVLLGTAFLAYSLGLRHALDADHIAAIDNVTRRLMQAGQRPVGVGFFFALGHSTVVVAASIAVALAAQVASARFANLREVGAVVGTSVSALFLFAIAIANLVVLRDVYRAFHEVKRGERMPEEDVDALLAQRGWLARLFRPLFGFVAQSWHLYPIGLLFALGFETASEISLFGISAEASKEVSSWSILIFPALFAAGMTLVDTADGMIMLGAYGWAYVRPLRKLFYNLTITFVSVVVALVVGGIEALGLVVDRLQPSGAFWDAIGRLNANLGALGYAIVAFFVASWIVSTLIYRLRGYERDERALE
jgi:nickel/cobalt transporter (NiCoT) family protein